MIGITGAMEPEISKLRDNLENKVDYEFANIKFSSGKLWGVACVIALSGCGKVNAAMCTQIMILKYRPEFIINVGVAGSLVPELKPLDIVVSRCVVQYDVDTSALGDPKGFISGPDSVNFLASTSLLKEVEKNLGVLANWNIHIGTIASGDKFISDAKEAASIKDQFSAIAVEMEGAAIGHVCHMNGIPFIVVRAISDVIPSNQSAEMYNKFLISARDRLYDFLKIMISIENR